MSRPILGQQYLDFTRRTEALTPGWLMTWKAAKTAGRNASGTKGRKSPVETSPRRKTSLTSLATTRMEGEERMEAISGHER